MDMEYLLRAYFDSTCTRPFGDFLIVAREVHEEYLRTTNLAETTEEFDNAINREMNL